MSDQSNDPATQDGSLAARGKARVYQNTVKRLAFSILKGDFPAGHVLPPETDLCDNLGISRSALRESVRALKDKGMLIARPRHGTIVQPRSAWHLLDADLLNWSMEVDPDAEFVFSLFEARQVIEPAAARLSAMRATSGDIEAMEAAFADMSAAKAAGDFQRFNEADIAFHLALLRATSNVVFIQLSNMIGTALAIAFRMSIARAHEPGESLSQHGDLIEMIRARDPIGAENVMTRLLAVAGIDLGLSNCGPSKS
jgi:DNA-binding FadR family transcriptional regulator